MEAAGTGPPLLLFVLRAIAAQETDNGETSSVSE
jgi:hypothetical protein